MGYSFVTFMIGNMCVHLFFLVKSVIRGFKMSYYKYRYKYIMWQRKRKQSKVVPTSVPDKVVEDRTFIDSQRSEIKSDHEDESDWEVKISPRLLDAPRNHLINDSY